MSNAKNINDIDCFNDPVEKYSIFKLDKNPADAADRFLNSYVKKDFESSERNKDIVFDRDKYIAYFDGVIKGKKGFFRDFGKPPEGTVTWGLVHSNHERPGGGHDIRINYFHEEQHRGTKFGKNHHFVCREKEFYSHRYGLPLVEQNHKKIPNFQDREIIKTKEAILSDPDFWGKYKDKDVLIVAAGPSSRDVKWQNVKHDYLWTCNEFYYCDYFDDKKLDFACLAAELDIYKNESLDSFIEKHPETNFGFEVERGSHIKDQDQLNGFLRQYEEKSYFFHTRYRAVIGMGARQIIAAIIAGAKNIYVCGLDGRDRTETNKTILNVFNNRGGKSLPTWFHQEVSMDMQYSQFYIFWGYIAKLAKEHNCSVFNIGQGNVHNKSSEMTRQLLPWTDELREMLK